MIALSVILLLASGQTVETIDESFEVTGRPRILVSNEDGRTELRSHAENRVAIHVTKEVVGASSQEEAERLARDVEVRITETGASIEAQTIYPSADWSFDGDVRVLVHMEIQAPRQSDLDVSTADGRLTVEGFEGDLRLSTEDGDLSATGCSGSVRAKGEDGDVSLLGFEGEVDAGIEDGDLRIEGTLHRLVAEAEDGDLDIRLAPASRMSADWSLRVMDGGIRMRVPSEFAAELDVDTDDGSIDVDLEATVSGNLTEGRLFGSVNGGGYQLRIRTEDGSVHLSSH
ncbi:MAG: DUF4097 family beta strand repeat-containing protein [Vicinamibacteria bacterium]